MTWRAPSSTRQKNGDPPRDITLNHLGIFQRESDTAIGGSCTYWYQVKDDIIRSSGPAAIALGFGAVLPGIVTRAASAEAVVAHPPPGAMSPAALQLYTFPREG